MVHNQQISMRRTFLSPLDGIINAKGAKCPHETNTLLAWQCHVGAMVVGHRSIMGHAGGVSVATSTVFPGYMKF
jgi:hypothetical protein